MKPCLKLSFPSLAFSLGLAFAACSPTLAHAGFEEDYEAKQWREIEIQLPAAPIDGNLLPIYVSAATDNEFMVDAQSVSVGADGVVRYTLVVNTAGGAKNVSYEGIRCQSKERRLYAFGQRDGAWSKSRGNEWTRIQNSPRNRHHSALYNEYFCPGGAIVWTAEEAVDALKRGGHPLARRQ